MSESHAVESLGREWKFVASEITRGEEVDFITLVIHILLYVYAGRQRFLLDRPVSQYAYVELFCEEILGEKLSKGIFCIVPVKGHRWAVLLRCRAYEILGAKL